MQRTVMTLLSPWKSEWEKETPQVATKTPSLSIVRVETGIRIAKSLRIRIHLGGFICLQIYRHEVPLQATRIHARGNALRDG